MGCSASVAVKQKDDIKMTEDQLSFNPRQDFKGFKNQKSSRNASRRGSQGGAGMGNLEFGAREFERQDKPKSARRGTVSREHIPLAPSKIAPGAASASLSRIFPFMYFELLFC